MEEKSPVTVIDYGVGNIASVLNMIRFVGGDAVASASPDVVREARMLILPGVGSFDAGMTALHNTGMDSAVKDAAARGATILGICLGMQLFMESSEEGTLPGLGLVRGRVKRFQLEDTSLRVPHMGWNVVRPARPSRIFDMTAEEQRFYFVHSYYVECDDAADIAGFTQYGMDFTSAIEHDGHIIGVQFHPEKSHRFGMNLFRRLLGVS
jgi:glutamine amidotransferase